MREEEKLCKKKSLKTNGFFNDIEAQNHKVSIKEDVIIRKKLRKDGTWVKLHRQEATKTED